MRLPALAAMALLVGASISPAAEPSVSVYTFNVDSTPPLGSPMAYTPARSVDDPLYARGIVILPAGAEPIVLCAVDWIGIANGGHDLWRRELAKAASTSPPRVAVHTLHQHDAPNCDFTAEELLSKRGLGGKLFSESFARETVNKVAQAIREGLKKPRQVTHLGIGKAKVEKVASNRRILGPDGKVAIVRYSSSKDPRAAAAPEGVIDPFVQCLSFWDGDTPLAVITYYATHPQSHYGQGNVSSDFPGIARTLREKALPGPAHIHFNGAGGNVAAGKYNDGSPELRPILAARLADGMRRAWEATTKTPLSAGDIDWRVEAVALPVGPHLVADELRKTLDEPKTPERMRLNVAEDLAWVERATSGHKIELSCLRLGNAYVLHMPGELFVEYQLAAQRMRPDATVCMAAYGDYGPGYIGTQIAYSQGGYETGRVSRVSPRVEQVLMAGIGRLLITESAPKRKKQ